MSKIGKLISNPSGFFRDYFKKRENKNSLARSSQPAARSSQPASNITQIEDLYPVSFPIDIVYTWVDGANETFLKQRAYYKGEKDDITTDIARFESRDELKYSVRSVLQFAPWVNHIYIVTNNGEIPKWLDTDFEKITIVPHKDIIEEEYLPTFNSHVIEANLWKIPNLSEHFIYFNDDVMLTRPVSKNYFYTSGGLVKSFITNVKLPQGAISEEDSPTIQAAKNARSLILQHTDNGIWAEILFAHTFHPFLKSVQQYIYQNFTDEINGFMGNRFRSPSDVYISFLHHHLAVLLGKGVATRTHSFYFNIRDKSAVNSYKALLRNKGTDKAPYSMCLNDLTANANGLPNYVEELTNFLENYFPKPSAAEIKNTDTDADIDTDTDTNPS